MKEAANSLERKYKDRQPAETVHRIRNILNELGLLMVEEWTNSLDGLYSLRLAIAGTGVGTNGKGTTPGYALASAYAEFMERLQNHLLYFETDFNPEALAHGGFYYAVDEKHLSVQELLAAGGDMVELMVPLQPAAGKGRAATKLEEKARQWFGQPEDDAYSREELARRWIIFNPEGCPSDFVAKPFYSVRHNRLYDVPVQMSVMAYGSNGMCAGNTPEEALVQGFSELFERFVNKEIIIKKITPPTVPDSYLQQFPRLFDLIEKVERESGFRVIIKDCSLGQGLPVLALVVIDPAQQQYYIKFGSHPVFAIALERCLTELLQGKTLQETLPQMMTAFRFHDRGLDNPANVSNIMKLGTGSYPAEFFAPHPSYPFREFKDFTHASNRETLHHCVSLLLDRGHDVLIRDVSFLGFPSFFIIVPGFSEIFDYDQAALNTIALREKARFILHQPGEASPEELRKVISFLLRRGGYLLETDNLTQLLGFPVKAGFPWLQVTNLYFIAAALYKMNKQAEALGMISQLVELLQLWGRQRPEITGRLSFYRCVRDYLEALTKGLPPDEIKTILGFFHSRETLEQVLALWGSPESVFDDFGSLNCWDCSACDFSPHCSQHFILQLHKKIKDREQSNPIDQKRLANLFRDLAG